MMAARAMSLDLDSIIDVEFETVLPARRAEPDKARQVPECPASVSITDSLALLRCDNAGSSEKGQPEQLTPAFLFFTFLAAIVVFWVSGGHALLY